MSFMTWIITRLNDASDFFYDIYLEVYDWVWPMWLAAEFFYELSSVFVKLAWGFADFSNWVDWAIDEIGNILSWSNIKSLIRSWLYGIEDALDWFLNWAYWVGREIDDWWDSVKLTVQDWIDVAVEGLADLLVAWDNFWNITWPQLVGNLSELRSLWDNFWSNIFPTLVDFTWLTTWWNDRIADIMGLIDTAFIIREGLWAGWQDWRDTVIEFFSDPLEWLWGRFTDWFLGAE